MASIFSVKIGLSPEPKRKSFMANSLFRFRPFIAFFLVLSFLLSALSGIILFLRPEGTLAAWTGWSALGLNKKQWEALHAFSVFFFILGVLIHLVYNWRPLIGYIRRFSREFVVALLLLGLTVLVSLQGWPPGRWLADLRGAFKSGTAEAGGQTIVQPPVVDADKLTLTALCPLLGMDETRLLAAARRNNIKVAHLRQTLAEVARLNGLTPEQAFKLLMAE